MKKVRYLVILLFLSLSFLFHSGCQSVQIEWENPNLESNSVEARDLGSLPPHDTGAQGSLVLGYFPVSDPVLSTCMEPKRVVIYRNYLDLTIHFFVGGIYTTRRIDIQCPQ
jgi:hypothetical protein